MNWKIIVKRSFFLLVWTQPDVLTVFSIFWAGAHAVLKWARTLWSLTTPHPPRPLPTFCLLKTFSQRVILIREVRTAETKENSQRIPNNNNAVSKQGLEIILWATSCELSTVKPQPGGEVKDMTTDCSLPSAATVLRMMTECSPPSAATVLRTGFKETGNKLTLELKTNSA